MDESDTVNVVIGKHRKHLRHSGADVAGRFHVIYDLLKVGFSFVETALSLRGKPAPDVFLLAARTMGHAPENCTVIEDSLPGVLAARAAGMHVYAFVEDPACDREAMQGAGAVLFEAMADLPDLLFSKT